MFEPSSFMKAIQLNLRSCTNYSTKTNYLILLYQLLVDVKKDITKYCPIYLSLLFSMKENFKPMKEMRIIIGKYFMKLYKEEELYELFYTYYYEQDIEKLRKILAIPESYKSVSKTEKNEMKDEEFSIRVGYHNYNITKPIIPLGKSSILLTTKASERKEINYNYYKSSERYATTNRTSIHHSSKDNSSKTKPITTSSKSNSKSQTITKTKVKVKSKKQHIEEEMDKVISLEVLLKEYEDVVPCPVNLLDYFSDDYSYNTYTDSDSSSTESMEDDDKITEYSACSEESSVTGDHDDELQLLLSDSEGSEEEEQESEVDIEMLKDIAKDIPVISSPVLLQEYFTDTNPYNSERSSFVSNNGIEIESVDENKHLNVYLSNSTVRSNDFSDVLLNLNDSEISQDDSYYDNIIN